MTNTAWIDEFKNAWGDKIISTRFSAPNEAEFQVSIKDAHDFLSDLKNKSGIEFNHLADLTAYDESPSTPRFFVVYELISMNLKQRCSVIVACDNEENPSVNSVSDLWPGAEWLEREVYDLFGINFKNNKDLRRILLPSSFVGHPLRKDFVFDYRQEFPDIPELGDNFDPFGSTIVSNANQSES